MRILEENNYILECWKCDTKIIYTYKDCSFDSRYISYELCCPNCHNRYSSTRNELFGKKYKENKYNSDEKEIKRLNNIIDKLSIEIECGTGRYTYDTDYNRGLSDAFNYMNDKLKELTEENNE